GQIFPGGEQFFNTYDGAGRVTGVSKGLVPQGVRPPNKQWMNSCLVRRAGNLEKGWMMLRSYDYAPGGFLRGMTIDGAARAVTTDGFGRIIQIDGADPQHVDVATKRTGFDSRGRVIWEAELDLQAPGATASYQKPVTTTPGL